MNAIFAPDTNFFLQCRSPDELDWSVVTDRSSILLLVLEEVYGELDRQKGDGNGRRARRARKWCSLLLPLAKGEDDEVELRASNPRVAVALAPLMEQSFDAPKADQRIVLEAQACSSGFSGNTVEVLSGDGGTIRFAKKKGVKFKAIPEDWLLKVEAGEEEKALRAELELLRSTKPKVALKKPQPVIWEAIFYPPLSDEFLDDMVARVAEKNPMKSRSEGRATSALENLAMGLARYAPEWEQVEYNQNYWKWRDKLRDRLSRTPQIYNRAGQYSQFSLILSNTGSIPAENLVIDLVPGGNVKLVDPDAKWLKLQVPPLPWPPEPPDPTRELLSFDFRDDHLDSRLFSGLNVAPPFRNRRQFYWHFEGDALAEKARGECAEFRHQAGPIELPVLFTWASGQPESFSCSVGVVVSATNLPSPVKDTVPIKIEVVEGDSEALVRSIVTKEFGAM